MSVTFGPYRARVDSVHDGDTVYLSIDLGFDHLIASHDWDGHPRLACRVFGINAPELDTQEGKDALIFARSLLSTGDIVSVTSHGWDKYGGRFDGQIILANGLDFGKEMLASGHAVLEAS